MEITGKLKKTGTETRFVRMEFTSGSGTEKIIMNDEEE
jgi:hypothetical protein